MSDLLGRVRHRVVPASVFGRDGAVPPSERIVLGGIGIGNRGTHVLNWMLPEKDVQFVAICDIRKKARARPSRDRRHPLRQQRLRCTRHPRVPGDRARTSTRS
jgi:hypothetical protein